MLVICLVFACAAYVQAKPRGRRPTPCTTSSDCNAEKGEVCAVVQTPEGDLNLCLKGCSTTSDCRKGSTCGDDGACHRLQRCTAETVCPAGIPCVYKREEDSEGRCRPLCSNDNDCPQGTTCNSNVCEDDGGPRGRECATSDDCTRDGEVCAAEQGEDGTMGNVCLKGCSTTSDCRKGSTCGSDGACHRLQRCTAETVCPAGTTCVSRRDEDPKGRCQPPCNSVDDCPRGSTCNSNVCEDDRPPRRQGDQQREGQRGSGSRGGRGGRGRGPRGN